MEPVSLIVGALAAGALAGTQDAASSSVKDAYIKLKALIHDRLEGRPAAQTALAEHEREPEAWGPALEHELTKAGVDADPLLVAQARALIAEVKPNAYSTGDVWNIDAREASRSQFGNGNLQYNQPSSGPT